MFPLVFQVLTQSQVNHHLAIALYLAFRHETVIYISSSNLTVIHSTLYFLHDFNMNSYIILTVSNLPTHINCGSVAMNSSAYCTVLTNANRLMKTYRPWLGIISRLFCFIQIGYECTTST